MKNGCGFQWRALTIILFSYGCGQSGTCASPDPSHNADENWVPFVGLGFRNLTHFFSLMLLLHRLPELPALTPILFK